MRLILEIIRYIIWPVENYRKFLVAIETWKKTPVALLLTWINFNPSMDK